MSVKTTIVKLPVGYREVVEENGSKVKKVHREATIKELDGYAEEAIYSSASRSNPGALITTLLQHAVTKIGDYEISPTKNKRIIESLTISDRMFLMIEIRRLIEGDILPMSAKCPYCGNNFEYEVNLAELEVSVVPDDKEPVVEIEFSTSIKDKNGNESRVAIFKYPDGKIQKEVLGAYADNVGKATTAIAERCLINFEGLIEVPPRWAAGFPLSDRKKIRKALIIDTPGYNQVLQIPCPNCGRVGETTLELDSFLA